MSLALVIATLTQADIQTDITNTFKWYFDTVTPFLDPIQNILQSLALNPTTKEFMVSNGHDIGTLVDLILKTAAHKEIPNIAAIVEIILKDKTLYQVIDDKAFFDPLIEYIKDKNPSIAIIIEKV